MRKISSSDLAEMLNKGFDGEVKFSGRVFVSLRRDTKNSSLDEESPPNFFHSEGNFSLVRIGRDQRVEEGSYSLECQGSEFYFKPKKRERIESNNHERYGDVIAFPIDFPTKAVLQIEPRGIIY